MVEARDGSLSRRERRLLALASPAEVNEIVRDLNEECARRRAAGGTAPALARWRRRQVAGIVLYAVRDRLLRGWRSVPGAARGRSRLQPLLALRLGARSVRRSPGVPLAAALTLGLGFGAAAAIYGVYAGFSRPLPVPDGGQVRWIRVLDQRGRPLSLARADLELLAAHSPAFATVGGFLTRETSVAAAGRPATRVAAAELTAEVADMLAVTPARGRHLGPEDHAGVVISGELWADYLDGDESVLGGTLRVDGEERTVLGIMPEGHRFPFHQDIWLMLAPGYRDTLEPVVRLDDGVDPERAAAEVERLLSAPLSERDGEVEAVRAEVPGFTEKRGEAGENAALATLLMLVVALVLVSCSNVSNLLFARALGRADALAVHAALGAGPGQVALQMFSEALLIALGGAAVGMGLAAVAIAYIEASLSDHWGYYWMAVRFDPAVVLFTLALAVITGLVSGMLPALRLWHADLNEVLKADAAGVMGGGRRRGTSMLLNGQVAFSCLALVIAMLMAGALRRSQVADGFRAADVFVASLALDGPAYDEAAGRRLFRGSLLAGLQAEGEIAAVAMSNVVPGLSNSWSPVEIEGAPRDPEARPVTTAAVAVTGPYFDIFGVRLLQGRRFTGDETGEGEGLALVSESFVRRHLPGADVLGRRLRLPQLTGEVWLRVIGVVADRPEYAGADPRALTRVYVPFAIVEPPAHYLLYTGSAGAGSALRGAIAALDPDVAVAGMFGQRGEARVADVMAYVAQIFETVGILAVLGGAGAVVVAIIGLYGALAFEVQRRRGEIGVRMALGAARADVARHMVAAGLWRVAPGLLLGFVVCAGTSPLLGVLLGGMSARDPYVYVGVYGGYLLATVLAMMVPARRAARLDPAGVLRKD